MIVLYILFILLVVAIIISAFFVLVIDSFQGYIIRINEAEANIETTLNKRFDLLNKSSDIIKKSLNTEEDLLKTIINIRSQKLDNFELDKKLYDAIEEFHEISEDNIELKDDDEYTRIEIELIDSEASILSLKKYYNDIVNKYNDLILSFPYKLVGKVKKYEQKNVFSIENHLELINSLKQR